jgi:tetratricopeptide (TPR) repeat protein
MFDRRLHALAIASIVGTSLLPITARAESDMDTANKLFAAKKYEQAILEYQKVLEMDPDHWRANYYMAMSWLAQFHPQSARREDAKIKQHAVASLEKLMTLAAPRPEDMVKVGNYYLSLLTSAGDNDEAIAFLEKQIQKEPDSEDLMAQLAQLHAKVGNFDESLRWYEKLAQLDPNEKANWYGVGVLCWERSNKAGPMMSPDERTAIIQHGIDSIDQALAIDDEYMEAIAYKNLLFREKADALSKAGKLVEAQAALAESQRLRDQAIELMQKKKAEAEAAPSDL